MNQIGYSAINIGINELSIGTEKLKEMTDTVSFPVITSNLVYKKSRLPIGKKYIIQQVGDVKVGILGITPIELSSGESSQDKAAGCSKESVKNVSEKIPATQLTEEIEMIQPEEALKAILPEVRNSANVVVLLSQYPLEVTRTIVKSTPGIDLAISSPLKKWVTVDEKEEQIPVMQTQYGCKSLGYVKFRLDDTGKILDHKKKSINLNDLVLSDEKIVQITSNDINQKIKQEEAKKMEEEAKALSKLTPAEYYEKLITEQSENKNLKGDIK